MHPQGYGPAPPASGTIANVVQRVLLLELLADPPAEPESIHELAVRLREPVGRIRAAAAALEAAGLADRARGRVRASASARYFDALWPVAL